MRYWRTSGQIDPGYFVAALLRCCFGVVQVAGWQPLHGAGKGGLGWVSPRGFLCRRYPFQAKPKQRWLGSHNRRLLDVGIILTNGQKKGVSRVAATVVQGRDDQDVLQ